MSERITQRDLIQFRWSVQVTIAFLAAMLLAAVMYGSTALALGDYLKAFRLPGGIVMAAESIGFSPMLLPPKHRFKFRPWWTLIGGFPGAVSGHFLGYFLVWCLHG